MPTIQIFTEPASAFGPSLIRSLARHWRRDGISVAIGPAATLEADVGILNIDRTRIPRAMVPANPHHRPLLNGRVLDISKRRISAHLVTADSTYDGQVIVKTDANYWGIPERRARIASGKKIDRLPRFYEAYEIFDRLGDVPDWVWLREDLVVERFRPETDHGEYVLRSWIFFGEEEYGVRMIGPEPIVKLANISRHEYTDEVPDSLRQARARLGFDFGKFDYVVVDGEVILFDTNKTPGIAYNPESPRQIRLARAIHTYLPVTA